MSVRRIPDVVAAAALFLSARYETFTDKTILVWRVPYGLFTIFVAGIMFGGLLIEPAAALATGLGRAAPGRANGPHRRTEQRRAGA